jgi:hypothetical protein
VGPFAHSLAFSLLLSASPTYGHVRGGAGDDAVRLLGRVPIQLDAGRPLARRHPRAALRIVVEDHCLRPCDQRLAGREQST